MSFYFRGDREWVLQAADIRNGSALVPGPFRALSVIFSDGLGWEHVSVSTPGRCPNWEEMCFIKHLFWSADDIVIQYHPPESEYVNVHRYCLHLWRPEGLPIPIPPRYLVG